MNGLAVCAGIGGLELGLRIALGDGYRTVCYVEGEAYAAAILRTRMEDETLDEAPIWSDVRTFNGSSWRDKVDFISAGYPCQPFSFAGRRRGTEDPRHLWPHVRRIVEEVEPRWLFCENVPGHARLGFRDIVHPELCSLGYRVEWDTFSAAEIGATHRRERLFFLAYSRDIRCCSRPNETEYRNDLAEDESRGCLQFGADGGQSKPPEVLGNPNQPRSQGRSVCGCERTDERPAWPPSPSDANAWRYVLDRWPELAPAVDNSINLRCTRKYQHKKCGGGGRMLHPCAHKL